MKNLFFIIVFLFFQHGQGQVNVQQLKNKISQLPLDKRVETREFTNNSTRLLHTVDVSSVSLSNVFTATTSFKYDNKVLGAKPEEELIYSNILSSRVNIADVLVLPEYYVDITPNGSTDRPPIIFRPIITNWSPLVYENEEGKKGYRTKVSFVLFSENGSPDQQINNPVNLEIASNRLTVEPRRVIIKHVNLPSTDFEVFTKDAIDSVDIRIITNSNVPDGYTTYLGVNPALQLLTNQNQVQGLGIQEASVLVRFKGSSSSEKEMVNINASAGEVVPASFQLAYNQTKTVKVRSQGLDDIKLTASTSSSRYTIADSNTVIIHQVFPYLFLIFALAGGLLGALIRFGFEGSKKYPGRMMMGGVLMGLLGALAYYVLGINFLKLEVSGSFNEFAVLTFSALCSLLIQPFMLKKNLA